VNEPLTNWAGSIVFSPRSFHRPTAWDELPALVAGSDRLKVLGSAHSFSTLAATDGDMLSLEDLPQSVEIDQDRRQVTVTSAVRYAQLSRDLHTQGLALRNLGSLPHISVGGACSTGTHGSGDRNGNLSSAVAGVEVLRADGELVRLVRGEPGFDGCVVSLGALGVITRLTLDVEPTYDVRQTVYQHVPHDQIEEHLAEVFAQGYSVSVFTDWRDGRHNRVWIKQRAGEAWQPPPRWRGGVLADREDHPVPGMPPTNCTAQLGVLGPWHERLPHFRHDSTPSVGEEIQTEYLLPIVHAADALRAMRRIGHLIRPVLQISEIRTVAADRLWLSPSYEQDTLGVHFTFVKDPVAIAPVIRAIEAELEPYSPRPHWGKLFSLDPEVVRSRYPRFDEFRQLTAAWDPKGVFHNAFLEPYLR
jgi:xylitol oxidase